MNYDLAKRNRLKGKFNFKLRDWQVELEGVEDYATMSFKSGRPKKPKSIWEQKKKKQANYDEQHAS